MTITYGQWAAFFVVVIVSRLGWYKLLLWLLAASLIVAIAWSAFRRFSRRPPPAI